MLVVKPRDLKRVRRLLGIEHFHVFAGLSGFLAVWVLEQKILKTQLRILRCRCILRPGLRRAKPNVAELILRVGCDRFVGKLVDHCLVSREGGIVVALFLARQTDIELCTRGVFAIRSGANNGGENVDRFVERVCDRHTEKLGFLAVQVHLADPELRLNRFVETLELRIPFDHNPIRLRRFQVIVILFEQLGTAISCAGRKRVLRVLANQRGVDADRPVGVARFLSCLRLVEELLRSAADLLIARRNVLGFMAGLKNDRSAAVRCKKHRADERKEQYADRGCHAIRRVIQMPFQSSYTAPDGSSRRLVRMRSESH